MISLSHRQLIEVLGTDPGVATDTVFSGVTIDSRQSGQGKLFVAIKGDNFDGHQFVDAAYRNGAVIALVEHPVDSEIAQVVVEDCKQAMGQLANYWRWQCNPCVIALTGSNGKTTVKEMLNRILLHESPTLATRGNFNNDIGLPLTLFELQPTHDFAVIEMGANHRGEIARLAEIAEPDIVYVNNVAAAHLAGFGNIQGVIEAKGELYAYCAAHHKALFNADEAASQYWMQNCAAKTRLSCALNKPAEVSLQWSSDADALNIEISHAGEHASCQLALIGEHNARNALAAVSLALLAGLELATAVANLAGFSGVKGRLQMRPGPAQSRIIDDSYNANPDSLEAGIKALCALQGTPWLALGDMAELGEEAVELHREAAVSARRQGVEKMFGVGEMSCQASANLVRRVPVTLISTRWRKSCAQIHKDVNLLVKGSRSAGMEQLVELLSTTNPSGDTNAV